MLSEEVRQLCRLFAEILDYPGSSLPESAAACARRLEDAFPGSAGPMQQFATFVGSQRPGQLEELYTRTFDTTPATTLYVGYHLFGETPRRSALLVKLAEAYHSHHLANGSELADHLCVILRFLSIAREPEFFTPLLQECVLPVLEKIEEALPKDKNGYQPAVSSLKLFLRQANRRLIKAGGS